MYCVFSIVVDHVGEIAVAGSAKLNGGANTFLITAAGGEYKGNTTGIAIADPINKENTHFLYMVEFH